MDISELDSCDICMDTYDESRRPHSLPCGHTICGCCVTNGIEDGHLKCPLCQRTHRASSVNDIPINYNMESIITKLRQSQLGAVLKDTSSASKANTLTSKIDEVIADHKNNLENVLTISEEISTEVRKYQCSMQNQKKKQTELSRKMSDFLRRNEEIIRQIEQEEKTLAKVLADGEQHQKEAKSNISILQTTTRVNDFYATTEHFEKTLANLLSWNEKWYLQFPNVKLMTTADKMVSSITTALNVITAEDEEDSSKTRELASSLSGTQRVGEDLSLENLQNMSIVVKFNMITGNIYAVQSSLGRQRSARITCSNNRKYLHYLKDEKAPGKARIVKHSDLIGTLTPDECLVVFMDVEWGGVIRGRVHIKLYQNTPLGDHFRTLCTGDLGVCYAKTRFLKVEFKGNEYSERITGGDYDKDTGDGGAVLFSDLRLNDDMYKRKCLKGSVQAAYCQGDGSHGAQFHIYTGRKDCGITDAIFGQVQDGLEVIREAVRLADIKEATIADCGVVLPF